MPLFPPCSRIVTGWLCLLVVCTGFAADTPKERHYAPSRQVDVLHHKMEVTPDFEGQSVSGVATIQFKPIALPLPELTLAAVDLDISNVESPSDILDWQNTGEELIVTFASSIAPDEETSVTITWSVEKPDQGLYFRTPQMGYPEGDTHLWTQGEMHESPHWFPCYDFPNEKFTTEMICHVADDMVALSNGKLVSNARDPNTGMVAWHWLQDKPHVTYLITLCAGYFEKVEERYNDIPMAFWAPPSKIDYVENSFAGTREMMAFFEAETGLPYPWARYDQVAVDDFSWGGMENTTQTTLNDSTLYPDELEGTRSSIGLVAHELAHQWFGNYVTTEEWAHIWLNEGFATYYEALFREHEYGRNEFLYDMLGNARSVFRQSNDVTPIVYREYGHPVEQFGYRAYPKGAWILHMIRSQLGPDLYRRCVKTYLERHPFGVVTTSDFIQVIEELSGRDWDRFFDQFVFHAHHPELKISYQWDEKTRLARITVEQTQELSDTVLLFDVPLKFRFISGTNRTESVARVSRQKEDFYFSLPSKPDIVRADPEYALLTEIDFPRPDAMLHAQLANTNDLMGRIEAIEAMKNKDDQSTIDLLKSTLKRDGFWGVRVEAARALKNIHSDAARTALLESQAQPDARVRREITQGIAAFYREETPEELIRIARNDANPDVRTDAIRKLDAYPVEKVKEPLVEFLNQDSYRDMIAGAAIDAIRGQHHPDYLEPLMTVLKDKGDAFETGVLRNGLNTVAALASETDDKSAYREFLSSYLNSAKRRVVETAIEALGTLGDPRAIAALETFQSADPESREHKAADSAIRKLRESRPQSVEVNELRGEVMELQKQNRELKQELETLKKQFEAAHTAETEEKKKGWFSR